GRPGQAQSRRLPIGAADLFARLHVGEYAIPALDLRRDAHREILAEREPDGAFAIELAEVAGVQVDVAVGAVFGIRPFGDEVDRAASGIAAEERVLRSAQHFDTFHAEQAEL